MCATVCPSGALYYGPRSYVEEFRREHAVNEFQFGRQTVRTKVNMMTSSEVKALPFDVLDFLPWETDDFDPMALARAGAPDVASSAVWEESIAGKEEAPAGKRCSSTCSCH